VQEICRNTPLPISRQLRREANFGCARCGHPLLDNAHIIPYSQTREFKAEDMIALCPNCHRTADDGDYPESVLRKFKSDPYNKSHINESFLIMNQETIVNIGGIQFIDTPRVLVNNDFDLISVKKGNDGDVLLDVNFYNRDDNLVAQIKENFWTVYTDSIWDLIYKPQALTILDKPRGISFGITIENGEIFIRGNLYYKGFLIEVSPNLIKVGNNQLRSFGGRIKNAGIGINCSIR
jgi:hypothetical protein